MTRAATILDIWRITARHNVPGAALLSPVGRWTTFRRLLIQRRMGPCASVCDQGRLLAVIGLVDTVPGVAEAWAVVAPSAATRALRLVRDIRTWLARRAGYHRIGAAVADVYQLHRFCHALGFRAETRLEKADAAGGPVYIYAMWPEVN